MKPPSERDGAIDALRGMVMVLMVIDHTRDFFQPDGASPENPLSSTPLFFLMRWVTHTCAPVFIFLAGASTALAARKRSPAQLQVLLLTRGVWLMFLEVTWVSFSWFFDFDRTQLGILWGIGGAMVLMSCLIRANQTILGAVGALTLIITSLVVIPSDMPFLGPLFVPQGFSLGDHSIYSVYVIGTWFSVMTIGYASSNWLMNSSRRHQATIGAAMVVAFLILRALNAPGEPTPWELQDGPLWRTAIDFFNPSKYPPSIHYLLMTLGASLMAMPLLAKDHAKVNKILHVFGRVPLFFYLMHLPMAHAMGTVFSSIQFETTSPPADSELSLIRIVIAWLVLLGMLYPMCVAWGKLKQTHKQRWWTSYV